MLVCCLIDAELRFQHIKFFTRLEVSIHLVKSFVLAIIELNPIGYIETLALSHSDALRELLKCILYDVLGCVKTKI